jgi:hypothetical protein
MQDKNRNILMRQLNKRFALAAVALLVAFAVSSCKSPEGPASKTGSLRGGETRETLNPEYFVGATRAAYQIAKEIPGVLDSLYCYCECKKNFGHKSLLSCYVDDHGAYCDICMEEAFMAYELHKQGKSVAEIRRAVDGRYARLRR